MRLYKYLKDNIEGIEWVKLSYIMVIVWIFYQH
jgi:hypothetical protein